MLPEGASTRSPGRVSWTEPPEMPGGKLARHTHAPGRTAFTAPPKKAPAPGRRGSHRAEDDRSPLRGRVTAAAVVAGAIATGSGFFNAVGTSAIPLAAGGDLAGALLVPSEGAPAQASGALLTVHEVNPGLESAKLVRGEGMVALQQVDRVVQQASADYAVKQEELRKQQEAEAAEKARREAEEAAKRPKVVKPAQGSFTSGFGARWGTTHYGIDIANSIGTPILSAMDGTVIEAGSASGFGLWVRVRHDDGTVTVYGHVDTIVAYAGTRVSAGQQIATMGNRGQSTGPHLHFEVWLNGGQKIDPVGWLAQRGIAL